MDVDNVSRALFPIAIFFVYMWEIQWDFVHALLLVNITFSRANGYENAEDDTATGDRNWRRRT